MSDIQVTKRKKRVNPGKGSSFERHVSKKLSLWVTKNESDNVFWRSITSGARATMRRRFNKSTVNEQFGDITSTDSSSKFFTDTLCIECKADGKVDLWDFAKKNIVSPNMYQFWNTIKEEAKFTNKYPILIIKPNYKSVILVIGESLQQILDTNSFMELTPIFKFYEDTEDIFIYDFETIMNKCDIDKFKEDLEKAKDVLHSHITLCNS